MYRQEVEATISTGTEAPESVNRRRLARSGGIALVGFCGGAVLQFAVVLLITRGISRTGAGIVLEAIAIFTLASTWSGLGADTGLVRFLPALIAASRRSQLRALVLTALVPVAVASTLAGAALGAAAPWLAPHLFRQADTNATTAALRLLAVFLPFGTVAGVAAAGSRGLQRIVPYVAIINLGIPAGRVIAIAAVLVVTTSQSAVLAAWAVPLVAAAVAALITLRAAVQRLSQPGDDDGRGLVREFWSFAGPRGLAAVCGTTVAWIDVVLVGAFTSPKQAAVYAAASRIAVLGAYALQAAGMVMSPEFSRRHTLRDWAGLGEVYRAATLWMMMAGWPFCISVVAFPTVYMRVFGHGYDSGADALAIIGAAQLVNLATGNITFVLLMTGRSRLNMMNAAVNCTTNVSLNLLLIPRYGIVGAAVAWAVCIVGVNLLELAEAWRTVRLRPFSRRYATTGLVILGCWGAAALVARLAAGESPAGFAVFVAVGTLTHAGFLARSPEARVVRALLGARLRPRDA